MSEYERILAIADSYKLTGQLRHWLQPDDFPFEKTTNVTTGGCWRLNIPTAINFEFTEDGLTFTCDVDLESREANGSGVNQLNHHRFDFIIPRLPAEARLKFYNLIADKFKPPVQKLAEDIFDSYRKQLNSLGSLSALMMKLV